MRLAISPQASPSGEPRRIRSTLYWVAESSSALSTWMSPRDSMSVVRSRSRNAISSGTLTWFLFFSGGLIFINNHNIRYNDYCQEGCRAGQLGIFVLIAFLSQTYKRNAGSFFYVPASLLSGIVFSLAHCAPRNTKVLPLAARRSLQRHGFKFGQYLASYFQRCASDLYFTFLKSCHEAEIHHAWTYCGRSGPPGCSCGYCTRDRACFARTALRGSRCPGGTSDSLCASSARICCECRLRSDQLPRRILSGGKIPGPSLYCRPGRTLGLRSLWRIAPSICGWPRASGIASDCAHSPLPRRPERPTICPRHCRRWAARIQRPHLPPDCSIRL